MASPWAIRGGVVVVGVARVDFPEARGRGVSKFLLLAASVQRVRLGAAVAADAVNLRRLDGFTERHRRDDRGNAFSEHGFAGARWPEHEQVVIAGDGDLDGTLRCFVTTHVCKINVVVLVLCEEAAQILALGS